MGIFGWKTYDPSWLVDAAKSQYPEDLCLQESLLKCTKIKNGVYFVDPKSPNETGSEWQFRESITLEDTKNGDVALDILKDGRVGSLEIMSWK